MIFLLVGPSAVGKTTLINEVKREEDDLYKLVSHTTRDSRENEKDGREYFFFSEEEFLSLKEKGGFVETTEYRGTYYGLSRREIENVLSRRHGISAIDRSGLSSIEREYGDQVVSILVIPPSIEELRERMKVRYGENEKKIQNRLENVEKELSNKDRFNYILLNDDLNESILELRKIYRGETDG